MTNKLRQMIGRYDAGIWIRVIGTALSTITGFMIRPFLVLYLFDRTEGSVMLPMLIVALQPLCGMIVSWTGGGLSDRYGRKPIMFAALMLQMLSMFGYVFADDVWQYAGCSIVNGIGSALFMPAANAQITDMVPEERRAEVFALMHTAFNVGAAVGPAIGLFMFQWDASAVFLASALAFLLYGLLVAFKLSETAPSLTGGGRRHQASSKVKFSWANHKPLILLTLLSLPVGLLYGQTETTLPLHLQTSFDDYKPIFAALLTFNGLMVIALQIWIARKSENVPSRIVIGLANVLLAVVALGYGYADVVVLLFVAEFVFTIGEMLFGPHYQKTLSVMAPPEQRGFYFSVNGAVNLLSRALGPLLGGWLLTATNGETLFTVLAFMLVAAGYLQYRVVKGITS
ncbi:MDR family MFS transporter [Cohnella sp. GCM10027633]|uniref:MDR family MFS transporter n=1 Tax=unclassified Cohnella TaxID=2636738 RepID=UPI003625CDCC